MKSRTTWGGTLLLVALAGAALATDQEDVTKLPGYVDFGAMNIFGREDATVEVFLEGPLIKMIAAATHGSDPDLSAMLAKLKQIRVQTFPIEPDKLDALEKKTAEVCKRLEQNGWQTVVRVKSPKENSETYVYMKFLNDVVQGLALMSIDPKDEASFVNIVGELDPKQLEKLTKNFNINSLDSLDLELKGMGHRGKDRGKDHKDQEKPKE